MQNSSHNKKKKSRKKLKKQNNKKHKILTENEVYFCSFLDEISISRVSPENYEAWDDVKK
jgi:hypothetical protein